MTTQPVTYTLADLRLISLELFKEHLEETESIKRFSLPLREVIVANVK
jgi:hypothetical protein